MSYTPVELRHVKVGRSLFGYNRATVEQLIEEVAQSFEATWRERGELADKVESLEKQITELRGREHLLTQTLVAAEQAASDVRERARREAETIVEEAHHEARAIGRAAHSERERLFVESKRIEGMLRAALGMMETEPAAVAAAPAPTPAPAPAPLVAAPALEPEPAHVAEPEPAPTGAYEHWPVVKHEPEPEPIHHHETTVDDEYVDAVPLAPASAEPEVESEYGWVREDTREFEPISSVPEHEPVTDQGAEPHDEAKPVLERIPGIGSRDFDWGE